MIDASLLNCVKDFRDKRILVVGDLMLDEYLYGHTKRISPEAPVPVVEFRSKNDRPGGAANVGANVVSLGANAVLVGVVGGDDAGERLLERIRAEDVDVGGVFLDGTRPTTTKTRVIAQSQQVLRIDRECKAALPEGIEDTLIQYVCEHIADVDACILSDYAKGVVSLCRSEFWTRPCSEKRTHCLEMKNG